MDIATVIGLISGIGLLIVAILMGGSALIFWDTASMVLVVGGTLASTLINYPLHDVLSVFGTLRNAFFHKSTPPDKLIEKLVAFATVARREGILALESQAEDTEDPFLKKSVQLAIDGAAPELIKDILTTELAFMESRHQQGQAILNTMGSMAPAFGMIGTLIGLVQMFMSLNDPSQIGGGMAVAILTTLYGAMLANILFLPCAGKLKVRTSGEVLAKEIIIEGILSIQSGDNPRVVEQKLKSFVAPAIREQISVGR